MTQLFSTWHLMLWLPSAKMMNAIALLSSLPGALHMHVCTLSISLSRLYEHNPFQTHRYASITHHSPTYLDIYTPNIHVNTHTHCPHPHPHTHRHPPLQPHTSIYTTLFPTITLFPTPTLTHTPQHTPTPTPTSPNTPTPTPTPADRVVCALST